jgi:hypothetical protein
MPRENRRKEFTKMTVDPDIIDAQWRPIAARTARPVAPPFQAVRNAESVAGTSHPRRPAAGRSDAAPDPILSDAWPTLAAAMHRYEQNVAEEFTREAYHRVSAGIIRHDARKRLAARAAELNIRPFDAQLLIACAVRQWSLDKGAVKKPIGKSFRDSVSSSWRRMALLAILAGVLDAILIWQMNH